LTEVVEIEEDLFLKNLNVIKFFNIKYEHMRRNAKGREGIFH